MPQAWFRNALFSMPLAWGLAACIGDSGKEPPPVGANYLDPRPNSCTEFALSDILAGQKQVREHYQVFFRKKNDSIVAIDEMVYGPALRGDAHLGSRSSLINTARPTGKGDSAVLNSNLYSTYRNRYRDRDEVRKAAMENVKLEGLLPESNARKIGFAAPFLYGSFSLDTAYVLINGDLDNSEWAYAMIFRKNGELILSYRFKLTGPAQGEIAWIAEETHVRCDSILIRPDPFDFP